MRSEAYCHRYSGGHCQDDDREVSKVDSRNNGGPGVLVTASRRRVQKVQHQPRYTSGLPGEYAPKGSLHRMILNQMQEATQIFLFSYFAKKERSPTTFRESLLCSVRISPHSTPEKNSDLFQIYIGRYVNTQRRGGVCVLWGRWEREKERQRRTLSFSRGTNMAKRKTELTSN